MTSAQRDASVGACKDALGVLGADLAYPARHKSMNAKLDRIARRRGLPNRVRICIWQGIIADLYELRQELILMPIDDGTAGHETAKEVS